MGTPAFVVESVPDSSGGGGNSPAFVVESIPEEPGFLRNLARVPGRTVRAAAEGIAGAVSPFANALGAAWNETAGRAGAPKLGTDAVGGMSSFLDRLGVSRPENSQEEGFDTVARALAGTAGTIATAGRAAGNAVADALAASPMMQALSTMFGSGAGEVARQSGASPLAQAAVSLAAGAAPSLAQGAIEGGVRAALRGGGDDAASRYNANRADWERVGVTPSVGQVAGTRTAQGVESVMSKTPGGAGVMSVASEKTAQQMGERINRIADELVPGANSTKAGATIEKGIKAFVQRFKDEQSFLYDKLDEFIPAASRVNVNNTSRALADLNSDIAGAPELSKWFKNARIQGIEGAMKADVTLVGANPDKVLPYEAVKKLRTLVGKELEGSSLASDVPRSKWKALYSALSDDLEGAANSAGPRAKAAFDRANWYSRAGYDRIETILDRVTNKDTAEKVFQAAVNSSEVKEGATTINAVMRSLSPEERNTVSAAVIRRLGVAGAGKQDDAGNVFSSETFLTNWNKISDDAKRVLFPSSDSRKGLDDLALAASRIRNGSKVFANPSGTSGGAAQIGAYGGLGVAIATGNVPVVATILGGIGSSYAASKLMTNPKFVAWVGKTTKMPPALLPTQLQMLAQQAERWPEDEQDAVRQFTESMTQQQGR